MYSGRGKVACNVVGGNEQGINNKRETETGKIMIITTAPALVCLAHAVYTSIPIFRAGHAKQNLRFATRDSAPTGFCYT